ncbi:CDP-alcohol phosphatidyltransferase family protein [Stieleria sp. ICT_E10.1]|uniref:CDP-alcohol phosphatidyltransferase family protein n=1 Tax=Stieleria sedimenti TaxID=2976331 RepID=UPI00217F8647|nr:CDP-alcohol phosphatidyltransferase family protein [Stieleria sedimenti]MCS7468881.1 CDP-alcohol phosphatidyltransferase family protein [Stieleria sedimenti]
MTKPTDDYQPDRRPIASRERAVSKRFANWLVRRKVTPNSISIAGMVAGIAVGFAFAMTNHSPYPAVFFLTAAMLMQLRLLANMLDGMVAVESGSASPVGELYNEIPDRVSDAAMFVGAGYAWGSDPTLGYIAACLALFVAYLRAQGKVAGAHQEYCGPLGKPQRVFLMTLTSLLCGLVPASWHAEMATHSALGMSGSLMGWGLVVAIIGTVWTGVRRLRRIAHALRTDHDDN